MPAIAPFAVVIAAAGLSTVAQCACAELVHVAQCASAELELSGVMIALVGSDVVQGSDVEHE